MKPGCHGCLLVDGDEAFSLQKLFVSKQASRSSHQSDLTASEPAQWAANEGASLLYRTRPFRVPISIVMQALFSARSSAERVGSSNERTSHSTK